MNSSMRRMRDGMRDAYARKYIRLSSIYVALTLNVIYSIKKREKKNGIKWKRSDKLAAKWNWIKCVILMVCYQIIMRRLLWKILFIYTFFHEIWNKSKSCGDWCVDMCVNDTIPPTSVFSPIPIGKFIIIIITHLHSKFVFYCFHFKNQHKCRASHTHRTSLCAGHSKRHLIEEKIFTKRVVNMSDN